MSVCPFVCMNTQSSVVMKATETKVGMNVFVYHEQIKIIFNVGCNDLSLRKLIILFSNLICKRYIKDKTFIFDLHLPD